jgi:hypothetical protein
MISPSLNSLWCKNWTGPPVYNAYTCWQISMNAFHPNVYRILCISMYVCVSPTLWFLCMRFAKTFISTYVCVSPKLLFLCMRFTKTFISMYAFHQNFYFYVCVSPKLLFLCMRFSQTFISMYFYECMQLAQTFISMYIHMYTIRPNFYFYVCMRFAQTFISRLDSFFSRCFCWLIPVRCPK